MKEVVIAGACRTAIGKFGGSLTGIAAPDLGAIVIKESLRRTGVKPKKVDEVIMGCVLQSGLGQNAARQAAMTAGIPLEVPALTVNNVCGSGLKAVNLAASMIRSGQGDIYVAGGMENMSAAPYLLPGARFGYRMNDGALIDSMINDSLMDAFHGIHMGITAENIAAKYSITREAQDEFAALSQQKCEKAQAAGAFREEIVPVPVKVKKESVDFLTDEYPRSGVTAAELSKLRPAFRPDGGTVTAGNSSGINDGAAAVVVLSADKAKELGVTPLARVVSFASAGVDPAYMGLGPIASTRKALAAAGLTISDLDLIEANEAFAAQSIAVGKELGWDPQRLNVNGGAIALGHPVGASGCRILVTLLHELRRRKQKFGLATLCVGGGMGVTTILERID